jgi:hypothetical protein
MWSVDDVQRWGKHAKWPLSVLAAFLEYKIAGAHLLYLQKDDLDELGVCHASQQRLVLLSIENLLNDDQRVERA